MAGVKGRSGGARSGSGRPRKNIEEGMEVQPHGGALKRKKSVPVPQEESDMLTLLQNIALGRTDASNIQVRAAIAAVQYTHAKVGEGGKKDQQKAEAQKVASKFAPQAPPKLVSNGGKAVK